MYEYRARVTRVVDGDTVHAEVDLGFDTRTTMTLRLAGINAPENSTDEGAAATEFLATLLASGDVLLRTVKDRREKYGRYLAYLFVGATNVNDVLVHNGHAVPYDGGKR